MRPVLLAIVGTVVIGLGAGAAFAQGTQLQLKTQKDKVSYSIGMNLGHDFKAKGIEVNPKVLAQGLHDAMAGGKTLLTDQEARQTLIGVQRKLMAQQAAKMKELAETNAKEGSKFLAENAKKTGVKVLPSGLQYKIIKSGKGEPPKAEDTVTVNYRGTLVNGKVFDSSFKRGRPATFPVSGVIPGWTEALQLMKPGARWELFIPPKLAYGARGAGPTIGPNSTLIFQVDLLKVKRHAKKK